MLVRFAWRNIWRNKTRSWLITGSIALGLMAGIFLSGLYEGMMAMRLDDVIRKEISHLQLHHPMFRSDPEGGHPITDPEKVSRDIRRIIPGATVSRRILVSAMIATSNGSSGIEVLGVVPEEEDQVTGLTSKLTAGEGWAAEKQHQAIIGKKLAEKTGARIGSKVILTFPDRDNNIVSGAFRVAGIYETRNTAIDRTHVYVQYTDLTALYGTSGACHEIAVLLPDDSPLEEARNKLADTFPSLQVETWRELSPEVAIMIETTDSYSIIFITIVMLALLFGIVNTMLMAVLERTREIGMLVALGMNRGRLFRLILLETVMLTFSGAPIGLILVWMLISRLSKTGLDISGMAGSTMSGYGFSTVIRPAFPFAVLPEVLLIVTITALMASIFPAARSARLQPADALRN